VKWRRGAGRPGDIVNRGRGGGGGFGGGMPIPIGVGGGGCGSILVILVLLLVFSGNFPGTGGGGGGPLSPLEPIEQPAPGSATGTTDEGTLFEFVSFLSTDIQNQWEALFRQSGEQYQRTKVATFTAGVNTSCGQASSATGPFYCPADRTVYIDLTFFRELAQRFGAAGDFAQAYVIAHEFGHHVQNLLGINEKVQSREDGIELELQADCLAGVWGSTAAERRMLERGDLEEALNAAAQIGDDRIQERTQGRVDPESWTHGSSADRQKWFRTGFDTGDPAECDTGI
jgi:predicted metalloprotease